MTNEVTLGKQCQYMSIIIRCTHTFNGSFSNFYDLLRMYPIQIPAQMDESTILLSIGLDLFGKIYIFKGSSWLFILWQQVFVLCTSEFWPSPTLTYIIERSHKFGKLVCDRSDLIGRYFISGCAQQDVTISLLREESTTKGRAP